MSNKIRAAEEIRARPYTKQKQQFLRVERIDNSIQ